MSYHHFIFDLDGTLVDSATEIHLAVTAVCQKHDLPIPTEAYIRRMTGSPPRIFFLDVAARPEDEVEASDAGILSVFLSRLKCYRV